ncbi:MAG: DUF308 domain-containing protein [Bacilli bacterium]|nr:DUF308 domain-containing protein [Bacilli bacterium]
MILEFAKRCEKNMLFSTVITLILGIILAYSPEGSIKVITGIIALMFLLIGILQLVDYIKQSKLEKMMSLSLILGILLTAVGVYLFINLESLANFITTLIGIAILIKSLFKLQYAFNIRDISDKWFYNLIVGIAGIVIGIILLVNPFSSAKLFLRIIGIIFILGSIIELVETFMVLKTIEDHEAIELPFEEKKKEVKDEK